MKCPVCRATYRPSGDRSSAADEADLLCRRCGVDLSPLIQIHDRAVWHYRQAIQALQARDYAAAAHHNHQALALDRHNADFHALAGQISALQGDLWQAIASWKTARQLDPQQAIANACLQCFTG
jgi:Tfp pilus assembly protein PilF